ncbi:MAG: hypothetical protein IH600_07460 [Bacteroidetes bacterium]|nr:hypothetical protein [Bacteroidota bacterium]
MKIGIVLLTLLLLAAAGLGCFGLYSVLTGDVWGLALVFMWLPPVILLVWMIRLQRGGRRMLDTDNETTQ